MCGCTGGVKVWRWRAVDDHGAVLDVFIQYSCDTEVATSFVARLLGRYDVPEGSHSDTLKSSGAAIRDLFVLHAVEHGQWSLQPAATRWSNRLIDPRATRVQVKKPSIGLPRHPRPDLEPSPSGPPATSIG
ncbi:DDE-type integrase/transposase/recombinase [uncultured Deinococcus sp.]|uniref:DDE-type integrase/transposase/recombinase n=1 Tax=uncultured Deinococcus sp. TaxID=158789 RepID=UPI00345BA29A